MLLCHRRNICSLASLCLVSAGLPLSKEMHRAALSIVLIQEGRILPTHVVFELREVMRFSQGKDCGGMYWKFRSDKTAYLF